MLYFLGEEAAVEEEAVEDVGIGHLVGCQVKVRIVHLHVGPVLEGVAHEAFELQLHLELVHFLGCFDALQDFFILFDGKLVADADGTRFRVEAVLGLLALVFAGYKLEWAH